VLRGRLVAADPLLSGAVQLIPRARVDSDGSSSEPPAQRSRRIMHVDLRTATIIITWTALWRIVPDAADVRPETTAPPSGFAGTPRDETSK